MLDVALEDRLRRDELLREFRSGYGYVFDIVCDIGAYRDMHRHRRCQQIRQEFTGQLGYDRPPLVDEAGVGDLYDHALADAEASRSALAAESPEASHYLLPFAARMRSLSRWTLPRRSTLRGCGRGEGAYFVPHGGLEDAGADFGVGAGPWRVDACDSAGGRRSVDAVGFVGAA